MSLGPLSYDVLKLVREKSGHGNAVARRLEALEGRARNASGVYTVLTRLADAGLVTSEWELKPSGQSRRRARIYAITEAGKHALKATVRRPQAAAHLNESNAGS